MRPLHAIMQKRKATAHNRTYYTPCCSCGSCCSCFSPLPPSFYLTHTQEEINAAINEVIDEIQQLIDESRSTQDP